MKRKLKLERLKIYAIKIAILGNDSREHPRGKACFPTAIPQDVV